MKRICEFAHLPYENSMLEYAGAVDVSEKPHQQRLLEPPRSGVRDWRTQMGAEDVGSFEAISGALLSALGYELSQPSAPSAVRRDPGPYPLPPHARCLERRRLRDAALTGLAPSAPSGQDAR